jgi:hypothetical protein
MMGAHLTKAHKIELLEREADVFSTTPGTAKDKVTKGHIAI